MSRRAGVALSLLLALLLTAAPAQAGELERRAQQRLEELGCDAGRVDGSMDPHTRTAILRFQAANDLAQSGRLTTRTRSLLYGEDQVRCDDRPVIRSGTGRRVVVSQRQNYVWLVRADDSVVAQGGMVDNTDVLSPGGYTVGSKCGRQARIRRNTDYSGRELLEFFVRFAPCGVGFHRIPVLRSTGTQIHPDWYLGTDRRESSGCIRLSRTMASRLWDFATVGTRVVVR